ncbi:helix-turn-helix transcriptional regulator [Xylophilus ampelinus]|uniref:AlpA family transcriptional regulator n=1 Tax=Xylophilus ampelinus TaxID=54067 RepID=A0A318SRH9_9BURK|nr:AlpA family phage regulatory protein [Xylophilus ampelinus]MCS4509174.1 AlpA family phage regulatory protein [Xylophilus ampelinus]PYE79800.1 AlpA family transcriptional regulator [Xylophilus ampelinus]
MTRKATVDAQPMLYLKPLYLAKTDAASFLSVSESTLEMLVAKGDAPKPRKISNGRAGWLVEELEAWGKARPVSDLLPPPNSGYGRPSKQN